jgi:hypothetical protein
MAPIPMTQPETQELLRRMQIMGGQLGKEVDALRNRVEKIEEVARAAGAIRQKINGQLQVLNANHWLGPELSRLDAALKALEA